MKGINRVRVSEEGRQGLKNFLFVLETLNAIIGLTLLFHGLRRLRQLTYLSNIFLYARLTDLVLFISILGILNVVLSYVDRRLSVSYLTHPLSDWTIRAVTVRRILSLSLVTVTAVFACILDSVTLEGYKEISTQLLTGMALYLKDPQWRFVFDKLQWDFECCGVTGYHDWLSSRWLGFEHIIVNSYVVNTWLGNDGKVRFPVVPYSCCSPYAAPPCLHDAILQNDSSFKWLGTSPPFESSLFPSGCAQNFLNPFLTDIWPITAMCILVCIFQLSMLAIGQYLYAASVVSTLRKDNVHCLPKKAGGAYFPLWLFSSKWFRKHKLSEDELK